MALRYVIKKRTFGFDKTKAEKYVAQNVITNTVDFRDLCEEITKVGMVPSGAVKFVLDALSGWARMGSRLPSTLPSKHNG